jgi:uncharacterized protein
MKTLVTLLASLMTIVSLQAAQKKLLVISITTGFRHTSIETGEKVLAQLAKDNAFSVDFVSQPEGKPTQGRNLTPEQRTAFNAAQKEWEETKLKPALAKLSPDSLKNYDGVIFLNTTGNLPIPDREGFLNWIKAGGAFIGMHAAGVTFHNWPGFIDMIGGEFQNHGAQVGVECLNEDPQHPATAHLGKSWTILQEEIYLFKNYDASKVRELLVLDKQPTTQAPGRFPVSWTKEYGSGKVFYTSLGHREDLWDTDPNIRDRRNPVEVSQAYQAHILGGIKWALTIK